MSKVSTNLTSKIARVEAGSEEYLKLDLRSASEGRESYACDRIGNFPSPRELANLDESFLAKRCGLGYRAGRILKLAQAIVEGRIHLKQLEEVCNEASLTSYDRLAEQLSKIYGFGPFTCANVLVCMGFYHVIPSDSETVRHLKQIFGRYAIAKGKSYNYILQFAICLGQLYGTAIYFITAYMEGDNFAASCFIIVSSNDITFLVEQPSQLKYLEWPSFQSTLKTATLTLVLVALLIVALSSLSVKDDTSYD
ncbi:hypothetical protein LWI28_020167 [Acer negundo]|uniref:DNA glycosylase n=1 Tax=Acer negundo TaxID=4023 RepID=A0AAD5IWA0_ACENE|nr:hypothetical protein LWI28_020167 [Acer negundo]